MTYDQNIGVCVCVGVYAVGTITTIGQAAMSKEDIRLSNVAYHRATLRQYLALLWPVVSLPLFLWWLAKTAFGFGGGFIEAVKGADLLPKRRERAIGDGELSLTEAKGGELSKVKDHT